MRSSGTPLSECSYEIRLGPLAWAFRRLTVPPPPSWANGPAVDCRRVVSRRDVGDSPQVTSDWGPARWMSSIEFEYLAPDILAGRAAESAAAAAADEDGWEAVDPDSGELNRVAWVGDGIRLVARRDGVTWAVVEKFDDSGNQSPDAASTLGGRHRALPRWTVALSSNRPRVATHAFFELLMPFVAAADLAPLGGLIFHGNALLTSDACTRQVQPATGSAESDEASVPRTTNRRAATPTRTEPPRVVVFSGHSGAGKSTLSRLACRWLPGWRLLAEDRLILLPRSPRSGAGNESANGVEHVNASARDSPADAEYCVAPWPTNGERWLRGSRNISHDNVLKNVLLLEHGNGNRVFDLAPQVAFEALWEQTLVTLTPPAVRTMVVDSIVHLATAGRARKYVFLPDRSAALEISVS